MEDPIASLMKESNLLTQLIELYQKKNQEQFSALASRVETLETLDSRIQQIQTDLQLQLDYHAERQKEIMRLYKGLHAKYILLLQTLESMNEQSYVAPVPEVEEVQSKGWKCWA
jgi:hypothetical protein